MSLLSRLFGSRSGNAPAKPSAPTEVHNGFAIYVEPIRDGGRWRIAARIEKEVDGELRSHQMIRADTLETADAAADASLAKARMLIDQQGTSIFS